MTEETKEKLSDFDEFELTEDDISTIEMIMGLLATPQDRRESREGVLDEGAVSKAIQIFSQLSPKDIEAVEVQILCEIIDVSPELVADHESAGFAFDALSQNEKTAYPLFGKRGFLIPALQIASRRSEHTTQGNVTSLAVEERESLYRQLYEFFTEQKKTIPPTAYPEGWFISFIKILTSAPEYRHLGLHIEGPKKLVRKVIRESGGPK
jgi:hypothetical protein